MRKGEGVLAGFQGEGNNVRLRWMQVGCVVLGAGVGALGCWREVASGYGRSIQIYVLIDLEQKVGPSAKKTHRRSRDQVPQPPPFSFPSLSSFAALEIKTFNF
ncbi:hypothetical protein L6452_01646 [Arctium lappa]|uniref:Uncharacterized protein n=1 Tax=Arctium lappa TaxID=4217 RepID=A0ACB9FI19_ARCLA|nr:hypothetical protein L6452_01646 [Arctium lappa]